MASAAELTKQGIAAHKAGDKAAAAQLLASAVQADGTHEMAWLWLSSCLSAPGEKRYCLDQALAANPQSQPARNGLAQLGSVIAVRPAVLGEESIAAPPELVRPHIIVKGQGYACSVCGGAVRRDALLCKHCKATLISDATALATPPKKRLSLPAFGGIVIGVLILSCVALYATGLNKTLAAMLQATLPQTYTVRYEVSGTSRGGVDLTLQNASGASEQRHVDILPWSSSFPARDGQFVYISAQKQSEGGTITCRILLNGQEVQKASADAAYGIATCSGRL